MALDLKFKVENVNSYEEREIVRFTEVVADETTPKGSFQLTFNNSSSDLKPGDVVSLTKE